MSTRRPGVIRPEDEYPVVEFQSIYAPARRRRRSENERNAHIAREIAAARTSDKIGMDELLRRLEVWGSPPLWR